MIGIPIQFRCRQLLLSKLLVSETVRQTAGDRTWELWLLLFEYLSTILEAPALAAVTKGGMQMARDPMKDALDYAERKPGTAYGHAAREDDAFNKSMSRNARAAKRVSTPSAKRNKPPSGFMRSVGRLIVGIVIFLIVISVLNGA